jgi:hypothetical protein
MLNLPTDNLYKFLAISGLIITLFSFYYPFQKLHELQFLMIEIPSEAELLEFQNQYLRGRVNYLEERHKKEEDLSKKQAIYDDSYKSEIELKKILVNIESNKKKLSVLLIEHQIYKGVSIIGVIFGVLLMVFGFRWWYQKIQKPLDYQSAQTFIQAKEKDLIIPP